METNLEPSFSQLSSKDFVPEKYVRDLSQNFVGGSELQTLRKKIQSLSDETSSNLKKNVYKNYVQFIETAKEISHLESEMYQLSHLLSEQKSLLSALSTTSILENLAPVNIDHENTVNEKDLEEDNKQKLASILEKVEGCKELLEVAGKTFLYEGDLLEIDPTENTALKTVHAYLFTDGFMITNRNSNSRSIMKYIYEMMYDLGSLAVVNVRDLGNVKHAFKLLIFPDTRVFQCSSNANKKEWLDKFDQAKKTRLTKEQQKRESIVEKAPSRSTSVDSPSDNPFNEYDEDVGLVHPEWFMEVPEELDVCVAQRHFEDALTLLERAKEFIVHYIAANDQLDHVMIDIQRKVEQRQNQLTEVLMKELEVNPDKSLQGGLRAARRAVRLLNQIGRSKQSCDLYLNLCTSMLKTQCQRVKKEGSVITYIRHISSVVFTNLCQMTEEFWSAFPDSPSCASAYVVWASAEISLFCTHFIKQVFRAEISLSVVTECVVLTRTQCERKRGEKIQRLGILSCKLMKKINFLGYIVFFNARIGEILIRHQRKCLQNFSQLYSFGVDMCYQLDGALRSSLTRSLRETREKLLDSIESNAVEDGWMPVNLHTKIALSRCLQEYAHLRLELDSYVTGDTWLQLTASTLSFAKKFLILLSDCLSLKTADLMYTIDETLYSVFEAQVRFIENALGNEMNQEKRQFLTRNAEFLLVNVLNISLEKYKLDVGYECANLVTLQNEYSALSKGIPPTARKTKTRYCSEFV